jgi:indolepyruvate ferredoxin oxidoreductase alpha subunit
LRALRRAGLGVRGRLGCEPPAVEDLDGPPGRLARLAGASEATASPGGAARAATGAALLAIADPAPARAASAGRALAAAGSRVLELPARATAAQAERVVAEALAGGPAVVVALGGCAARGGRSAPPLAVDPRRCNRCGGCLSLGCVALRDPGGEAMEIDGAACSGCGQCAPLCRAAAIAPAAAAPSRPCGPGVR